MDEFDPRAPDAVDKILTAVNWAIVLMVLAVLALSGLFYLLGWFHAYE